jgi:hypothetical protein
MDEKFLCYAFCCIPADNSGVWVYDVITLNHPATFTAKMYMNPIPQAVIDQNRLIGQNPGY